LILSLAKSSRLDSLRHGCGEVIDGADPDVMGLCP
jgi:hypothetical protein